MQRPGCDPENMQAEDFICDFCERTWTDDRPMVEGHRGSLICAQCLATSYTVLWTMLSGEEVADAVVCLLCLSHNGDPMWQSPARSEARICKRCSKQSVVMLERDPESGWKRPGGE